MKSRGFSAALFVSLSLASVASAELGSTTAAEITPGLNKITKQYHSCALSLAQVASALGHDVDAGAISRQKGDVRFGTERLQIETLSGLSIDGQALVFVPKQSFLVGNTETFHKMISSMASFTGHYLLRERVETNGAVSRFLHSNFALVEHSGKKFFLIPVEQYSELQKVLSGGENSTWQYERNATARAPSVAVAPKASMSRTGGGTVYAFHEDGSVTIYDRNGKVSGSFTPPSSRNALPFASHKAILARQGVVVDSDDPVVAIEVALSKNPEVMQAYRDANAVSPAEFGIFQHELKRRSDAVSGTLDPSKLAPLISCAVRFADSGTALLPPHLRWSSLSDPRLLQATDGGYRVISPFLFFRRPADVQYVSPEVRLVSSNALHLQAAHANLGNLALTLEAQGLVAGGHLSFEYDQSTGNLRKVRLEGNGLISLAYARGQSLKMTDAEIEWLRDYVRNYLPSGTEVEIIATQG